MSRIKLEEIRLGLEHKADITPYLIKEFLGESLREIRLGVEEGLDASVYAKIYFGWQQMREIRLGLERRVDVTIYARELYRWQQMREIRLGLEEGLDVSAYKSMMYSAKEMKRMRLKMKEQAEREQNGDIQIELLEEQARQATECMVTVSQDKMEAYVTLFLAALGRKLCSVHGSSADSRLRLMVHGNHLACLYLLKIHGILIINGAVFADCRNLGNSRSEKEFVITVPSTLRSGALSRQKPFRSLLRLF